MGSGRRTLFSETKLHTWILFQSHLGALGDFGTSIPASAAKMKLCFSGEKDLPCAPGVSALVAIDLFGMAFMAEKSNQCTVLSLCMETQLFSPPEQKTPRCGYLPRQAQQVRAPGDLSSVCAPLMHTILDSNRSLGPMMDDICSHVLPVKSSSFGECV